jgi:CMP-N,N'-diacetyllegionaminic acid synthase
MSQVIALIPARSGSKGIPGKNLRQLGGRALIEQAWECAEAAGCDWIEISTDYTTRELWDAGIRIDGLTISQRPAALCGDEVPMFDVVNHWAQSFKGTRFDDPKTVIVLLQPTQPFRTPAHVQAAIRLLRETQADSVVSVVELPRTHSPEFVVRKYEVFGERGWRIAPECGWRSLPACRQDVEPAYIRDGTVYAFPVKTLRSGTIYGQDARPLIIPPEESCELDTEADWAEVERCWRERHG